MKVVVTLGTFDLYHHGHVRLFKACRKLAEDGIVVVGLNSDEFIKKYKGKPPVMSYEERHEVVESCRYVDMVVENEAGGDSKPTLLKYHPDLLVIGSDWAKKDYYAQMDFTQEWLDEQDIQLVYVPYTEGISTTDIKKRLK
jgi:glycerol-3-phosphate cytidylyltransferase